MILINIFFFFLFSLYLNGNIYFSSPPHRLGNTVIVNILTVMRFLSYWRTHDFNRTHVERQWKICNWKLKLLFSTLTEIPTAQSERPRQKNAMRHAGQTEFGKFRESCPMTNTHRLRFNTIFLMDTDYLQRHDYYGGGEWYRNPPNGIYLFIFLVPLQFHNNN